MPSPLFGLVEASALARGPHDGADARATRRRVAILIYALLLGPIVFLGGWTHSFLVFAAAFIVLVVALLLMAERGDRIAARFRRGKDEQA